jgi:hypothetical protein
MLDWANTTPVVINEAAIKTSFNFFRMSKNASYWQQFIVKITIELPEISER